MSSLDDIMKIVDRYEKCLEEEWDCVENSTKIF
jgi:hypothetical protein